MKRDRGTAADLTLDPHRAAGLMGKTIDLGKAKAGATADILGREERFEDPVDLVGRNAAAGVAAARAGAR